MLAYYLNNEEFWLDENTSVVIVNRNPACYTDKLVDRAALGIEIPENKRNRALLGNPERFERYVQPGDMKFENFRITWKGAEQMSGTLVIDGYSDGKYTGYAQSKLGALGEAQQEKYMNEMDWPTAQTFINKASYNDADDDYGVVKIHNRGFWDGKGSEKEKEIAYLDMNDDWKLKTITTNVLGAEMYKNYKWIVNDFDLADLKEGVVISPFLYLRYVIKEIFRMNGFFIRRNDMLNDYTFSNYLYNQMVYNNFNIIDLNITTTTKQKVTWEYEEGREITFEIDEIDEPKLWQLGTFNYADLLPRKKFKEFILGIQNFHNYIFFFRNDNYVDIIDRNSILNSTAIDLDKYLVSRWNPGKQRNVRLKFVNEYDKDDGKFGDEFEDLSDRWKDFKEPVSTLTDLKALVNPDFGELRLVLSINKVYEYGWNVVTTEDVNRIEQQFDTLGWKFASNGPQPYLDGDAEEEEEIKSAISTTHFKSLWIDGIMPTMPEVIQKGNIAKMRSLWNDYTIRFIPESAVVHRQSMIWEGTTGLYKKRWANWARFWKTRLEISASFQLPLNMHTYIQNNITSKFRTDKGEFIIEEMETEFGMHEIGETKIKGYKV